MPDRATAESHGASVASVRKVSADLSRLQTRFDAHEPQDDERFALLTTAIAKVGADLTSKIDTTFGSLQTQVETLKNDKVRAEGYAAGVAKSKTPNPYVIAILPGIICLLLGFIIAWASRDHIQGGIGAGASSSTTVETVRHAEPPR